MNVDSRIKIEVCRRLDNRFEDPPQKDDSPRALELHLRRGQALHEVLDGAEMLQVLDWGETDDSKAHEFVSILIGIATHAVFQYAFVPGLKLLGEKLAEKLVEETGSEFVNWLIAKLRPKQEAKKVLDFTITLPDGTQIRCDPSDGEGRITINFHDGSDPSIAYSVGSSS